MNKQETKEADPLSLTVIALLKGIVYGERNPGLWQSLIDLQMRVREYLGVIGLELMLDESEGYAWLRQAGSEDELQLPRLVTRRQLSYPVSLLIALLRRRLAEHDAAGGETRLIMSQEEIVEMCRTFFPVGGNEARFFDQIGTHLNKVAELGFVRKMRGADGQIEVCRIIRAFVDAQWLNEFDSRLREYYSEINSDKQGEEQE